MRLVEIACIAIVAAWVAARARREPWRPLLARLATLAIASWIGEDTCVRCHRFYRYDPSWSLFVDEVPLLITLIWPVVIHSAWDLARQLLSPSRRAFVPLATGALVVADASLIEPIAVQAGLWSWSEPGLFAVPPVGILGWGFFAAACGWCLERRAVLAILVAPPATHALLIASWWGALRWVNATIPPWPACAAAWLLALPLARAAWRRGLRHLVDPIDLLARVPAALFFFALLGARGRDVVPLVAYATAFAAPWLAITPIAARPARGAAR